MLTKRQDNIEEIYDLLQANLVGRYQVTQELAPVGLAQRFLARDLARDCGRWRSSCRPSILGVLTTMR